MSRHPTDGHVHLLARVNLLSDSEFERMSVRRLRQRFVVCAVALALLVGGAWAFQRSRVVESDKLVAVEQAESNRLAAQTQTLAPVRAFVNGVAVQVSTVQVAMAGEVYFSEVLDGIRAATPAGAQLATIAVTLADPAAAGVDPVSGAAVSACPGPDPFNTLPVVGCVTVSGTAASRAEVGDLVVALGASPMFVEPFITTTTTGEANEVSFNGSVGLAEKVFSKRYGDPSPAPVQGGS